MSVRRLIKGSVLLAAVTGVASVAASKRRGADAPAPEKPESVPGWADFLDGLRDLPDRVLARLPADLRNDPQLRQEVGRLALSGVTGAMIDALASDPDRPVFVPQLSNYITTGQPNADTNYRTAKIAPGGTYRLRGRRGSMNQARIAQAGPRPTPVPGKVDLGAPRPVHDLNTLSVDNQDRYDVILSPTRPEGHEGDWWELDPTSDMLLVRMVASDWTQDREPTLSIERLDAPAPRPRPSAEQLAARLRAIPTDARFIAPLLVDRPAKMHEDGFVNALRAMDMTRMGGLAGQFYFEGAYALADDEALLIETQVPETSTYHSLILTNDIYETTDWYNNHSSLNGAQTRIDSDGVLRVVVSAKDPGVPNWLDTAGYPTGVIQGRWMECSSEPIPTVHKIAVADIRKWVPEETPIVTAEERDQIVRDRRSILQQRPLW